MRGAQAKDGTAIGLNACCDYNTRIGRGGLANGSATWVDQVIPENCFAGGIPAKVTQENITDTDRLAYFGVLSAARTHFEAELIEADVRKKKGL
jgi:hypothetical protein